MAQNLRAMLKKPINQSGQALIEHLVCIVALKMFVVGLLFLSYQIAIAQWVDFWSYRTLICLIESRQPYSCRKSMEEKMNLLLSPQNYRIKELWITHKKTQIKLLVDVAPFGEALYKKQIDLPLSPQ